ncbi:putative ferric-chelate reductase 1 [Littorina saxatilis]|uniref:Reelin domain-containing protein n=1 Tax=Littorina saxatilis TaxID=31220 RepID=A0AAN9G8R8_9CAEN
MTPQQKITTTAWNLVLGLLFLVRGGRGYPGGAPDMACQSMLPTGHGAAPQASDPPFNIFVNKKSYKPGETLQVVVQAEGDDYYKGFFLQARMTGCNVNETRIVGMFTTTDGELQTRHCFGDVHSAVTHNSNRKKLSKTFYWTAPVVTSGHVVMRATIVRELNEYWTEVESPVVADLNANISPKCATTLVPPSKPETSSGTTNDVSTSSGSSSTSTSTDAQDGTNLVDTDTTTKGKQMSTIKTSTVTKQKQAAQVTTKKTEMTTKKKAEVTTKKTEMTKKMKAEVTTKKQSIEDADGNMPSWLGPSFNEVKTTEETGTKDPSWLIPAYQKAVSSSPSMLLLKSWWYRCGLVFLSAIWTVLALS